MTKKFMSAIGRSMIARMIFPIVIVIAVVSGCSHKLLKYDGHRPDLSLSGETAQKEIRRFELEEDKGICGFPCFKRDAQKRQHTWESLQPLIEVVSPQAAQEYRKAKVWSDVQLYTLGIAIGGLVAGLATNGSQRDTLFSLSIAGSVASIGSSIYVGNIRSEILEIYNRDLKEKYIPPSVGVTWRIR